MLRGLEKEALKRASSLEEVAKIALTALGRLRSSGHQIVQICGPITTGGLGSVEANVARFKFAVQRASENGFVVFDLPAFQEAIGRVTNFQKDAPYNWGILDDFIGKVLGSGYISRAFFLPGWESSTGSKWEREQLKRLEIPFQDFPAEWLKE